MDQLCKRCEIRSPLFHDSHRVVVNAVIQSTAKNLLLEGWSVSPIVQANLGRPFNLLAGLDINGDNYTTNDRPYGLGRDAGRGPAFFSMDVRLSRRFQFGVSERRNVEFIAEGFNLANRTNFKTINNTVGAVVSSSLPRPFVGVKGASPTTPFAFTSAYDPRQFQLGLKVNF